MKRFFTSSGRFFVKSSSGIPDVFEVRMASFFRCGNILLYIVSFSLLFVSCSHRHEDLDHNDSDHHSYESGYISISKYWT